MKTQNIFKKIIAYALVATTLLTGCSSTSSEESTASADPIKIGIPSDSTNGGRALLLLEKAGLIDVDDEAGYTPELKDVTKYIYNIEIVPTQANTLVSTLDDFGAATINGTYAVPAGLSPSEDGLITEVQEVGSDNPYINVIVARTSEKDNETYQTIVKAYQSQLVAEYILEKNSGASVPAFDYDKNYTVDENFVSDIEGYQSDSTGKTEVKVGVCGSGDVWRAVQKVLDEENAGIYINVVTFDAYNLPNEALNNGEIDLNAFQHKAYLADEVESQGYDITAIGDTSSAPLTLYSKKVKSIKALKKLAGKKED